MQFTTNVDLTVSAATRDDAMAIGQQNARDGIRQRSNGSTFRADPLPGAVAAKAVKQSTTKAQRAMFAKHPDWQPWTVTVTATVDY